MPIQTPAARIRRGVGDVVSQVVRADVMIGVGVG